MESNIADKIKLFENTKIQYTAPLEVNSADSSQTKEEIIKLAPPSLSKPRRKKKLTQTKQVEQAEYVNVSPAAEAQWSLAPLSVSSSDYSQAYTNPCPFDLEQSEYANLLPLGISDTERFYVDPEGKYVTIKKKQTKKRAKELVAKETPIEAIQAVQFDLEQSEYANLLSLGASDTERFYADPEGKYVTIKKKQTKKRAKELVAKETPIAGGIHYAELDLTQSNQVNDLQRKKLDDKNTEYSYLGSDNRLVLSNKADQDKVLSIANNEQKTRLLGVEGVATVGTKNKIQRQRKKNKSKDDYLRPLTAKFEKFKIQAIQEESTLASSVEMKQKESMVDQYKFSFFAKKPEKLTQETKRSASNFSVIKNK